MNKRKFEKLNTKQKIDLLIDSLSYAFKEKAWENIKRKTDMIGIACQAATYYGIKRKDFNLIKDKTIFELIDVFEQDKSL